MNEKTTSYRKNPNGSYTRTGKIVQRPEDGWQESQGASIERRKGWGVWFTWETDDPKYTRPGLVIFLLFFIAIFTAIFWCAWEAARTPSQQIFSIVMWAGFLGWTLYVGNGLRKAINRREAEQQAAVRASPDAAAMKAFRAFPQVRRTAPKEALWMPFFGASLHGGTNAHLCRHAAGRPRGTLLPGRAQIEK